MNQILKQLGVKEINLGSCIGGDKWIDNSDSTFIESFNPTNGELLAKVKLCSEEDYESVISASNDAFKQWRMVPAPIRGQLILEIFSWIITQLLRSNAEQKKNCKSIMYLSLVNNCLDKKTCDV